MGIDAVAHALEHGVLGAGLPLGWTIAPALLVVDLSDTGPDQFQPLVILSLLCKVMLEGFPGLGLGVEVIPAPAVVVVFIGV